MIVTQHLVVARSREMAKLYFFKLKNGGAALVYPLGEKERAQRRADQRNSDSAHFSVPPDRQFRVWLITVTTSVAVTAP